jgi:hypothetical protein
MAANTLNASKFKETYIEQASNEQQFSHEAPPIPRPQFKEDQEEGG